MMKRPPRVLTAIAACTALTLAACGSDSESSTDEAPASTVGDATTDTSPSSEPDTTEAPDTTAAPDTTEAPETTGAPPAGGDAVAKLSSALENQDGDASVSFELAVDVTAGDMSQSVAASGQVDPVAMASVFVFELPAQGDQPAGMLETRVVDDVAYLTGDQVTAGFGADTAWVSIAAEQLANVQQVQIPGVDTSNPTSVLTLPPIDGAEVTEDGTATVAGVEVTNYMVSIDPAAAGDAAGVGQLAQQLVDGTLDFVVSIDADGQLRQLSFDEQIAAPDSAAGDAPGEIGLSLSITVTEYGANVNVEAPADADVTDVTDLVTGS